MGRLPFTSIDTGGFDSTATNVGGIQQFGYGRINVQRPTSVSDSVQSFVSYYGDTGTFAVNANGEVRIGSNQFDAPTVLSADGSASFGTGSISLKADGRIGIGTTAPAAGLQVNDSTTPAIRFSRNTSYYWELGHTNSDFQFKSETGGTVMHMNFDGNIGIGTTNPGVKLDIQGDGDVDTAIRIYNRRTGVSDDATLRLGIAGTTASNYIYFGDTEDNDAGRIRYHHGTNQLTVRTAATDAFRIDGSQNATFYGEVAHGGDWGYTASIPCAA